jgi:valyl-tRNA synthetase
VRRATGLLEACDYATARSEIESFFWTELADNYLEMCKQRLYDEGHPQRAAARFTLHTVLEALLKLFAPFLPYVTEEIYQGLFIEEEGIGNKGILSIHRSRWPDADPNLQDEWAEEVGQILVEIATEVRRHKSEASLSLGAELERVQLAVVEGDEGRRADGRRQTTDDGRRETYRRLQTEHSQRIVEALQEAAADLKSVTRARQVEVIQQTHTEGIPVANGRVVITAIEEI